MSSIWAVSRLAVKGHFLPNQGSRKSVVYTIQSVTENILQTLKWGLLATKEWSPSLQSIRQRFSLGIEMQAVYTYTLQLQVSSFPLILGIRTLDDSWCSYAKLWHASSMFIYVAISSISGVLAEIPLEPFGPIPYTAEFPSKEPLYNHAYFSYPNIQAVQQSTRSRPFFQNMLHL